MSSKKSTRFNSEADNSSQSEEPKTDQKPRSRNKEKHSTTSRGRRKKQAQLLHRERQRQRLSLLLLHTQEGKKERKRQRKTNTTANLTRNGSKEAQRRKLQSPTLKCMKRMQRRRREAIERSSEELKEKRKRALTRERQEWELLTQWRTRGALWSPFLAKPMYYYYNKGTILICRRKWRRFFAIYFCSPASQTMMTPWPFLF
jgi:hypothetical protein